MKTHRPAIRPPAAKTCAPRKIFLVDDHHLTRQGVALMIDQEPDLVVCGQTDDPALALKLIAEAAAPDLVVIDVMLKNTSGIELLKNLQALKLAPPALVLSMHDEGLHAERALRAGARGFVMKREPVAVILGAIRRVLAGELHLSRAMTAKSAARRSAA